MSTTFLQAASSRAQDALHNNKSTAAVVSKLTGRHVFVGGLAKRPELNAMIGIAEKWEAKSGRYAVRLPTLQLPILLKEQNLTVAPSAATSIAACCAAEHRDEVLERVREAVAGERHEGTNTCVLDLEHTEMPELPPVVGVLSEVRELWLAGNALRTLPPALCGLVTLRSLDLDGNKLICLPSAIGCLACLESLYANANKLSSLPDSIGSLRALKELRLSDNLLGAPGVSLGCLPEEFGSLKALRTLWLARNGLHELPEPVCHLAALEELDVAGNVIIALPTALLRLKRLSVLELAGNDKLVWPPLGVAVQGLEAVRTWVQGAEPREEAAALGPLHGTLHDEDGGASDDAASEGGGPPFGPTGDGGVVIGGIRYAQEAAGSMHTPLAHREEEGGGGSFIFPGR